MTNGSVVTDKRLKSFLNSEFLGTNNVPVYGLIGYGTSTPSTGNSELDNQIAVQDTESVDDCDAITGWTAGTDSVVSQNTTTFKEGTASLNVYKTGTTGTSFSASKTVTSLDFTSKDALQWIYVKALADLVTTGTAATIKYGSDSSNYYYLDVDISSLTAGWNPISFNSSNITGTTGSPVIASMDYYEIEFNTDLASDTITEGDIAIDDIRLASSGDYLATFQSTYPSVDESALKATERWKIGSTGANGYDITEQGVKDAAGNLKSRAVYQAITKTNTKLITFVNITKIRNK